MHQVHQSLLVCSTCGSPNQGQVAYCSNCTAPLEVSCPDCEQTVPTGSKFCGQCGAPLQVPTREINQSETGWDRVGLHLPVGLAEKIKAASVKGPGERRPVTVLQAGLANLLNAAHNLDNEDIYAFIDEAISLMAEVIYKYEGTSDKFTGDGLRVLFGVPVAHENDPERAVRAALDMQQILQPLQQRYKEAYDFDLQLRVGVHTGQVIAGRMGSDRYMEYAVIGDTVSLASELQRAAQPGMVLVSAETYHYTWPRFEFESLPALEIIGATGPVQVFRPLGFLPRSGVLQRLRHMPVELVGRDDELDMLQQIVAAVRFDRSRRVVLLTGEAGVGKSRLLAEFRAELAGSDVTLYQGACPSYARSSPFAVIAELLRDLLDLPAADAAGFEPDRLQFGLERLGLAGAGLEPYLANVLGLLRPHVEPPSRLDALGSDMLQHQTQAALRQVLLAATHQAPTVFIFEDLQWVDQASREFLEYIIQTTGDESFMLVLVLRQAEYYAVISSLLATARKEAGQLAEITLLPLSQAHSQQLVDRLLKPMTPEMLALKQKIVQRGEGNPFYLEEVVRLLIDHRGLISETPDAEWQITPRAEELLKTAPGTIAGSILARFDRLPESVRRTLQRAAVLGLSFPMSLLQTINETGLETLTIHLDELENRQFLESKLFPPEPGYAFRHTLLQETVYGTLLKQDRRHIHGQAAIAIEQCQDWSPVEKMEALAYHFCESSAPDRALPYLIAAADHAARQCAFESASEMYRQAMSLLPQQPNGHSHLFFQVRLGLGHSLKYLGEFAASYRLLSDTLKLLWGSRLARKTGTLWPVLVELLQQLADIRQREGRYDEALVHLENGLQVLGEKGQQESPGLWRLLIERQAWIYFRQGRMERALALAEAAVAELNPDSIDEPILLARLYNTLGGIYWQQGQRLLALVYANRTLELYQKIDYLWGVGTAYGNLGLLYDVMGDWPKADDYHRCAYSLQQSIGDLEGQARSLDNLSILHMAMGEHETARQEAEASLAIRQKLGDRFGIALTCASLAHLALIEARFSQAKDFAQAAVEGADTIKSAEAQVYARWILALLQADQEDTQSALASAGQALEIARAAGYADGEIDSLRVLGDLHGRTDQVVQAEAFLGNSLKLAVAGNDPYRQGLALLESGRLYMTLAGHDQTKQPAWQAKAAVALHQAIEIFESLGAAYDLRLARTALDRFGPDAAEHTND